MIPLVDLDWQHQQIADEVELGWKSEIANSCFILGPAVERFEKEFAAYNGGATASGLETAQTPSN